jgi:hypothetical protein
MSFPMSYAQPDTLAIPAQLTGEDLKSFRGAKNTIRYLPSSSGSTTAPSSSSIFNIPTGGMSYFKQGSFYLRGKCSVTQTGATGAGWAFAPQSNGTAVTTVTGGVGGASSLLQRLSLTFPGGQSMSYPQYNHFVNSVVKPHCLSKEYVEGELRQLEYSGVTKVNDAANAQDSKDVYFSIPLWLPCFNSNQAFPALLLNGNITLEIVTETVNSAFYGIVASVSNYSLSDLTLVYETIDVTPEFKNALIQSKAGSTYNIAMSDFMAVGPQAVSGSNRIQIGVGLSSLKSVLFTFQLADDVSATLTKPKKYFTNGLTNYAIYINNSIVSPPNITSDDYCYAEMNRALSKITDNNMVSCLTNIVNAEGANARNTYTTHNFLAGVSTQVFSDWLFASEGVPCDQLAVEVTLGTQEDARWQSSATVAASNMYIFCLYDSVLVVDIATGTVTVRK